MPDVNPDLNPDLTDLPGVWERRLAVEADGLTDRTTVTHWVQSHALYADLRQPPGLERLNGARCLGDFDRDELLALCAQRAFAGTLGRTTDPSTADAFDWTRWIDLHPSTGRPDSGSLRWERGELVEVGIHEPYVEHWKPVERPATSATAAARLVDPLDGTVGVLVRAGSWFGYARGRSAPLPDPAASLAEQVLGCAQLATATALLDCEVSVGRVVGGCWSVTRSSLPHRTGIRLAPLLGGDGGGRLSVRDSGPSGRPFVRRWHVLDAEGPQHLLTSGTADPAGLAIAIPRQNRGPART